MKPKLVVTKQFSGIIICLVTLAYLLQVVGISSSGWLVTRMKLRQNLYEKFGTKSASNNDSETKGSKQKDDTQISQSLEQIINSKHGLSKRMISENQTTNGFSDNGNKDNVNEEGFLPIDHAPISWIPATENPNMIDKTRPNHVLRPLFPGHLPVKPEKPNDNGGKVKPEETVNDKPEENTTNPVRPMPKQPVRSYPTQPVSPKPTQPVRPKPILPVRPRPVQPVRPKPIQPTRPRPEQPARPKSMQTVSPKPTQPLIVPRILQTLGPTMIIENSSKVTSTKNTNDEPGKTEKKHLVPTIKPIKTLHERPQKQIDNGGKIIPKGNTKIDLTKFNSSQTNLKTRQTPSQVFQERPQKTSNGNGKTDLEERVINVTTQISNSNQTLLTTSRLLFEINSTQPFDKGTKPSYGDNNGTEEDSENTGSTQTISENIDQNGGESAGDQFKSPPNTPHFQFPPKMSSPPFSKKKSPMTEKDLSHKSNSSRSTKRVSFSRIYKNGIFRIGLWISVACQIDLNGEEQCTQLSTRKSLLLMASMMRPPLGNDLVGLATWNDLRIEAVFALCAGAVGLIGTLLTVKPLCLKGRQRATTIVGIIGLVLSCILIFVPISRVASINETLKNSRMFDNEAVQVEIPWATAVSGIGACLTLLTAGFLAFYTWADERRKWYSFQEDSAIVYKKDNKPKDETEPVEDRNGTETYNNLCTIYKVQK